MRVQDFRVGWDHVLGSGREGGRERESKRRRKSEKARERVGRDHILDRLRAHRPERHLPQIHDGVSNTPVEPIWHI